MPSESWTSRRADYPHRKRAGRPTYQLYLRRHDRIDDWDLVDRPARSESVWERRTAIVATWHFVRHGELDDTFAIAELLVDDHEHLIQTAVGGWVREAGKRDLGRLRAFLDTHAATMPRTTLRYAIDHLDADERRRYRSSTTT